MNLIDFRAFVDKLFVRRRSDNIEANMHACVGLAGEAGECLDLVKKTWVMENPEDRPIDKVKLQTEGGDVLHYLVMLCVANDWTLEDLAANNKAKLDLRYPQGYSDAANIARADVKPDPQVAIDDRWAKDRKAYEESGGLHPCYD